MAKYEDQQINLDQAAECIEYYNDFQPDIKAFKPTSDCETNNTVVSKLNVDAKLFIPPYDRYRKYRTIAQLEEIKEFKEKEAKIAAISKGNELIKTEVLVKLQEAKALAEKEAEDNVEKASLAAEASGVKEENETEECVQKTAQRKRKISSDKRERKDSTAGPNKVDNAQNKPKSNQQNKEKNKSEPKPADFTRYNYKNANYRKLLNENDKTLKQPKMKFRKHK